MRLTEKVDVTNWGEYFLLISDVFRFLMHDKISRENSFFPYRPFLLVFDRQTCFLHLLLREYYLQRGVSYAVGGNC